MAIYGSSNKTKLYLGTKKIKNAYSGSTKIYSSAEIVTYIVEGAVFHQQEYEEGESVLSPSKSPTKSGYAFAGWSTSASGDVLSSLTMGDSPITLYAIWKLSTISGTVSTWNYKSIPLSGWSDKQYCYYYSPSWICGFYSTTYDLTNVKTLSFTVSTVVTNCSEKYYNNVVDVLAGVAKSTANTNASFAKSTIKSKVVAEGYSGNGTYTTTLTVDVSALSGTYYVGAAYRAYNNATGNVSKWNNYSGYFDCTSKITKVTAS